MSGHRYWISVRYTDSQPRRPGRMISSEWAAASAADLETVAAHLRRCLERLPAAWPPPTGDMHEDRLYRAAIIEHQGPLLPGESDIDCGRGGMSEWHAAKRHWDHQEAAR